MPSSSGLEWLIGLTDGIHEKIICQSTPSTEVSQPTYDPHCHTDSFRRSSIHKVAWLDGGALGEGYFGQSVFGDELLSLAVANG